MSSSTLSTRVRADVFPAVLTVAPPDAPPATTLSKVDPPAVVIEKVRVVVTAEQVLVFQDSSQGPELIFSEALYDYTPAPRAQRQRQLYTPREATLVTESGKTLAFHRMSGCGCGSRLKAFNPFAPGTTYTVSSTRDTPIPAA